MEVDSNSLLHAALLEDNDRALGFLLKYGADPNVRLPLTGEVFRWFPRLAIERDTPRRQSRSNSFAHRPSYPVTSTPTSSSRTLGRITYVTGYHLRGNDRWTSNLDVESDARNPTPLHFAAAIGRLFLVEMLLSAGAQLDPLMDGEYTPLAVAVIHGRMQIARFLIVCGADVHAMARRGRRLLHLAVRERNVDMVKLLVENGADVNARTQHGVTPLLAAVEKGLTEIVELLLKSDADVNASTDEGVTPLHYAAIRGHTHITEMILNHGADVSAIVKKGEIDVTPLLWVTDGERKKVVEVLAKHAAKNSPASFYGRFFKGIWKQFSGKT